MKKFYLTLASITTLCLIGRNPDDALAGSQLNVGQRLASTHCITSADNAAATAVYHKAWALIDEHYLFAERLKNWQSWEHKFDGKLATRADARKAIGQMIESLGDEFTYLVHADGERGCLPQDSHSGSVRNFSRSHGSSSGITCKKLEGGIGYLRISHFKSDSITAAVKRALSSMADSPGYVVDLRNNRGGYVDVAYDVFAMFTDEDKFTQFYGRNKTQIESEALLLAPRAQVRIVNGRVKQSSRQPNLTGSKPIAVLIDWNTRSAAEMLAGALRDGGRAVLVGTSTFGKGVLQDTFEIGGGLELKIVTARYFLPDGESIHGKGVSPNELVYPGGESDAQLLAALSIIEQSSSAEVNPGA